MLLFCGSVPYVCALQVAPREEWATRPHAHQRQAAGLWRRLVLMHLPVMLPVAGLYSL